MWTLRDAVLGKFQGVPKNGDLHGAPAPIAITANVRVGRISFAATCDVYGDDEQYTNTPIRDTPVTRHRKDARPPPPGIGGVGLVGNAG